MAVERYLDLSTGHVTRKTMTRIEENDPDYPIITNYPHGAILWVPEEIEHSLPFDLLTVLMYAKGRDCRLVRLDADGDKHTDLTYYGW